MREELADRPLSNLVLASLRVAGGLEPQIGVGKQGVDSARGAERLLQPAENLLDLGTPARLLAGAH